MHQIPWLFAALPRFNFYLLALLLTVSGPLFAATQNVVEVVFDGLPDEVTAETATVPLKLKIGVLYDKTLLATDRDRVTALLKDQGFLDADTKTVVNFMPAGVRLTFTVKARNRYTIEAVTAEGVPADVIAAVLAAAKIGKETPCTQAVVEQLTQAIAPKVGVNVLYLDAERKLNANKKEATLIFRR